MQLGGVEYPSRPPDEWPAYAPAPASWGGPPGPGPTPAPEGSGGGRGWPVVVVAVLVVGVLALMIVGVGTLASSDSPDEATDTTVDLTDPEITAPPSEEPVLPTMPTIPGFDPSGGVDPTEQARPLAEVLPELITFVEETRGREFTTDPVVEALPDDEFEDLLAAEQEEEAAAIADAAVAQTALGLLPPDFDAVGASEELAAVSVLGFYQPDTDELYVKGDQITPFVQSVIVHELTHALDDQGFDLGRLDALSEQPDEQAIAFLSLVEGTASFVQAAFEEQMSEDDAAALEAEQYQLGFDQLPSAIGLPAILLVGSQVPYASGERFVEALVAEGGTAEIDTAYGTPPTTGEQILDPAVFLAGEGPVALQPLEAPAGADVAEEGGFGAIDLRLLGVVSDPLGALTNPDAGLLDPVPGFGGGRYVSWTEGGRSCISLEAVGDDAAGSATIQDALETWAAAVPGAEVASRVGGTGVDVITALSCQ